MLEAQIKKLDDDLVEEARRGRDLKKNVGDFGTSNDTADATARRKAL